MYTTQRLVCSIDHCIENSMRFSPCLLPLAASVSALPSSKTAQSSTPSVTLDYTTVIPAAGNSSLVYYKYQNIRFAAVPKGDLRFAKPQWPPVEHTINNGTLADADVDCASTED